MGRWEIVYFVCYEVGRICSCLKGDCCVEEII